VELERVDGCDEPGSNWAKRIMYNDVMTSGEGTELKYLSKITLALLKDTGWYDVDLTKGNPVAFGKNGGCNFAKLPCLGPLGAITEDFCTDYGYFERCDATLTGKGICGIRGYAMALPCEH
jgi:hypothetical protein